MQQNPLKFRQIHLDFHTSPLIPSVGQAFDAKKYVRILKNAAVNSVTTFAKDHHGYSFHPTKIGEIHPNLKGFNLLRAQFDACKEAGINVPIYISAGWDERIAHKHPQWLSIMTNGQIRTAWESGYKQDASWLSLDFGTPYLDYLCNQIEEVVDLFPDADGIFIDICHQHPSLNPFVTKRMEQQGFDWQNHDDQIAFANIIKKELFEKTTEACRKNKSHMPVFHNFGTIVIGDHLPMQYNSHLELESLPTGGWGYEHFPISARYVDCLDVEFLGMTGKFHLSWGEFGTYKLPEALRYECAHMIAHGSKCSIGDHLPANGKIDETTYHIIGQAYREIEQKEQWCENTKNIADIGYIAFDAINAPDRSAYDGRTNKSDLGAVRLLLEEKFLFDVLDTKSDFSKYKLLIIADDSHIDEKLQQKLQFYVDQGGKLLLTGCSGLNDKATKSLFDLGAEVQGYSPFASDYALIDLPLMDEFLHMPQYYYFRSVRLKATFGKSLGKIYDVFFDRSPKHFSGHTHTPYHPEATDFDFAVQKDNITYVSHKIFTIYADKGYQYHRIFFSNLIRNILPDITLKTNMPVAARATFRKSLNLGSYILHLLYAAPSVRGAFLWEGEMKNVEVIQELPFLHETEVSLRLSAMDKIPQKVILQPAGKELKFHIKEERLCFTIPKFQCHQMVEMR